MNKIVRNVLMLCALLINGVVYAGSLTVESYDFFSVSRPHSFWTVAIYPAGYYPAAPEVYFTQSITVPDNAHSLTMITIEDDLFSDKQYITLNGQNYTGVLGLSDGQLGETLFDRYAGRTFAINAEVTPGEVITFDFKTLSYAVILARPDVPGVGVVFHSLGGDKNYPLMYQAIFSTNYAATVPEPESYAMFLAGLGLLGFLARRRSNYAA